MSNLETSITKMWFSNSKVAYLFWPLSLLYGLITFVRRILFKLHILTSYKSKVPTIVVGNIMIGGNGKTPVVIALIEHFSKKGMRVGVVSRGYKANPPSYPYRLNPESTAYLGGDEPFLIYQRTGAIVVIDHIRTRAVKSIENEVDVIITDDGLQHYALGRDIEIVVVDGKRRFGNKMLLPAGPLRETVSRLKTVDFVINNGGIPEDREYKMTLVAGKLISLSQLKEQSRLKIELEEQVGLEEQNDIENINKEVCALAGIGEPRRFYKTLEAQGFKVVDTIESRDHVLVDSSVIKMKAKINPLLMTEKDMVKYINEDFENLPIYALPVDAEIEDEFYKLLDEKLNL